MDSIGESDTCHDPGGKVRLRLCDGVTGTAVFSACGRHRTLLTRSWEGAALEGSVLWIGMNPSTAEAGVDDPTVAKECKFTRRWGYGSYVKANVMDYRATHPRMLLADGVIPCSQENIPAIVAAARAASMVVLGYGALHKKLVSYGEAVKSALASEGIEALCLALTKDGHPKHPLYIRDDTQPFPYPLQGMNPS